MLKVKRLKNQIIKYLEAGKSKGLNRSVKISCVHLREEYLSFNNK
jgi:hypothetical protein